MGLVDALDRVLVEGAVLARERHHGGAPYAVTKGVRRRGGGGGLEGGGRGGGDGFFKVGDKVEDGALGGGWREVGPLLLANMSVMLYCESNVDQGITSVQLTHCAAASL